ncbi:hypothetical protein ER308_21050 [Egibacter rhizosphaerae]|uniref:Uncharacterized protein n=1 Tax=Egibacter rhizosphaerae TaxID=1670831 RepID=A0A411YKT1_9ACTN|nr:hypothetical protein [Egibacter rhizosphaerae]QBI21797.1 hypothetical protein ER308_21050 [Egibacter rhizosphaerae]
MRGDDPASEEPDPVARNRALPRRHVPGRAPTGWTHTRRLFYTTTAVLVVATLTLVIALTLGRA